MRRHWRNFRSIFPGNKKLYCFEICSSRKKSLFLLRNCLSKKKSNSFRCVFVVYLFSGMWLRRWGGGKVAKKEQYIYWVSHVRIDKQIPFNSSQAFMAIRANICVSYTTLSHDTCSDWAPLCSKKVLQLRDEWEKLSTIFVLFLHQLNTHLAMTMMKDDEKYKNLLSQSMSKRECVNNINRERKIDLSET
jgi:hypothetical protein